MKPSPRCILQAGLFAVFLALSTFPSLAQKYVAPSYPSVGSSNTVTADPQIPRPNSKPCTVQLYSNFDFSNFNSQYFTYTPPGDCPGPWAKVILKADWSVDAGRQFDRTAEIWLNGVNIYFGTTAEPSKHVARHWEAQSDLTDYTPLFNEVQQGRVDLGNLVNSTYTSHLHGSASLLFYPLPKNQTKPPVTADVVLPMSSSSTGGTVTLNTPSDQLSATFTTLPTNVERAYLDVFAQSQYIDEFWYSCAPNNVASELFGDCGSTAFREAEVWIDGTPAGVAPVYPWIYTGGIDPYFWRPIPGVQTLNFEPYRVNLTPFAGLLSDGQPHTIAVSVYNADQYFSATATLLLYEDKGSTQVTGSVTRNTLTSNPHMKIAEDLTTAKNGNIKGTVDTTAGRTFEIAGSLQTSHGLVNTTVKQTISFANDQPWVVTNAYISQDVNQLTGIDSLTTTTENKNTSTIFVQQSWPLTMDVAYKFDASGNITQIGSVYQGLHRSRIDSLNGIPFYLSTLCDVVKTRDTLYISSSFSITGNANASSEQTYYYFDSDGTSWVRTLKSANGVLTSVAGTNSLCTQ